MGERLINFQYSQEQELMKRAFRKYFEDNVSPFASELFETGYLTKNVWSRLVNYDVFGASISEKFNGLGLDWITITLMIEELARADFSRIALAAVMFNQVMAYIVEKFGNDKLKDEVLPNLVKGHILGIASTESECGTDFTNISTKMSKNDNKLIINGRKEYISLAKDSNEYGGGHLVTCKHNNNMNFVYVPINTKGVSISEYKSFGPPLSEIEYYETELPSHYIIGEENKGKHYTMQAFIRCRILEAIGMVGMTTKLLETGIKYIKEREAFRQPIGKFEGIQFELAEHYSRIEAAKWLTYKAAWILNEIENNKKYSSYTLARESSTAKLLASIDCLNACIDILRWHGALGITMEVDLHLALRNILGSTISSGTIQAQKLTISSSLLGRRFISYK
jgi:acyl-CoA dehydrogenase